MRLDAPALFPSRPAGATDQAPEQAIAETSDERFDRVAFARRALDLVRPPDTTVAICEGRGGILLQFGRMWGGRHRESRWAMLVLSPHASRRAIALAVAQLARAPASYVFDVLMAGVSLDE